MKTAMTMPSRHVSRPSRASYRPIRAHRPIRAQLISPAEAYPAVLPNLELDANKIERVQYKPNGNNKAIFSYEGQDYTIDYTKMGDAGSPIVLIHGFGASTYHWRYNVSELAKTHTVYAYDVLGFGFSDKAIVDYSGGKVWVAQAQWFLENYVKEPAVLVGNSMGGFISLATGAQHPDLVKGVVLINAAGQFEEELNKDGSRAQGQTTEAGDESLKSPLQRYVIDPIVNAVKRIGIAFAFYNTKRPERIEEVLRQVYYDDRNVDADLVASIQAPAQDPNAPEVFYRVINQTGSRVTMNELLRQMTRPILLLWGVHDPWIRPGKADLIERIYPSADRVDIQAGHCAHDENPEAVNPEILKWVAGLDAKAAVAKL